MQVRVRAASLVFSRHFAQVPFDLVGIAHGFGHFWLPAIQEIVILEGRGVDVLGRSLRGVPADPWICMV